MVEAFDEQQVVMSLANDIQGMRCVDQPGRSTHLGISGTGFDAKTLQDRLLSEAHVAAIAGTALVREPKVSAHFLRKLRGEYRASDGRIKSWLGDNMSAEPRVMECH